MAQVAHSVYYYHISHRDKKEKKHEGEKEEIKSIFLEHKGRYGYRRITIEMRNRGYYINHKTVIRLMKQLGIKCTLRPKRYHSYKGEVGETAPNVLDRNFFAARPNQKWVTDVTQINIGQERLFLSPIVDLFNGEIIAYNISRHADIEQIKDMMEKALHLHPNVEGLIMHSDQGWQYKHKYYCKCLKKYGIVQSMSRKGNCLDNSLAENFFAIMKSELLYAQKFTSVDEFVAALEAYVHYYNNVRIKTRLGMSPVQYRNLINQSHINA